MEGKTIRSNELYKKEYWDDVVNKNGGWNSVPADNDGNLLNENIHYRDICPFYKNRNNGKSQNGEEGIIRSIFKK